MKKQAYIDVAIVDTDRKIVYATKIRNTLETFYKEADCSTIDIVNRDFHGHRLDVICDDEGLLNGKSGRPAIITLGKDNEVVEQIVGNCIVANHDEDGNMASLTREDYVAIAKSVISIANGQLGLLAHV